ncbi:hypothetical protein FACUT_9646 [Fusarium acutatum]|uniref:Uncharacterized protein n=1 Tax=Fusarium acutatum TaxID=78861 RepID=A0A8H4JGX0_9HYPO|nr:hypothetical protein FACUT_9646 [Fusarium acutatum]
MDPLSSTSASVAVAGAEEGFSVAVKGASSRSLSFFLIEETVDSIYAEWENRGSKLSTTEFDFDYELINTRAYRRALAQAQAKRKRELPRRELGTTGRKTNTRIMEDLIDLSCEPSQRTTLMLSYMPPQLYTDLAGLQFMPITSDENADSTRSLDNGQTADLMNTQGIAGHLRGSGLPPESRIRVRKIGRLDSRDALKLRRSMQ